MAKTTQKACVLLTAVICAIMLHRCGNGNELIIDNGADYPITFAFRDERITVSDGQKRTIHQIPNATYDYGTIYTAPAYCTDPKEGEGLCGRLSFFNGNTTTLITYVSSLRSDTSYDVHTAYREDVTADDSIKAYSIVQEKIKTTYEIGAVVTSNYSSWTNPVQPCD